MESCLKIGGEYRHGLGALLYKIMGKISISRATAQNTTTIYNNQNELPPPTLWLLCPSVSMSRGDLPPNHCAAVPLQVCAGREPSVLHSPAPVPLFGAPEWHPSKMREVGGASTLMAAVCFKKVSTLGDTSKKRRRWVRTCGEDVIPLFGAEN